MKIIKRIAVCVCILMGLCIAVCAETLPVKDVVCFDLDGWYGRPNVFVLLENGTLLWGGSPDTANPEVVTTGVQKMVQVGEQLFVLYENGDVSKVFDKSTKSHEVAYTLNLDAKTILSNGFYIDNANNLYTSAGKKLYENVASYRSFPSRIYDTDDVRLDGIILTLDGELYTIAYKNVAEPKLRLFMTNVESFVIIEDNCIAYKKNKDLVTMGFSSNGFSYLETTRIAKNVESSDYVAYEGILCYYMIDDVVYCASSKTGETLRYLHSKVKNYRIVNGRLRTYDKNWVEQPTSAEYFLAANGDLYYKSKKYYSNVKRAFDFKGDGFSTRIVFIITKDGKLYSAKNAEEPFLTSFGEKRTKVIINNQEVELKTKIQLYRDRSMYPFRECLEAMGASVMWDAKTSTAVGEYKGNTVEFPIGKMYYFINDELHVMDTASYISDNKTFIPIRFAAEALGFTVDWESNSVENIITISEN